MSKNTSLDERKQSTKVSLLKQFAPALDDKDLSFDGLFFQSVRQVKLSKDRRRAKIIFYDGSFIDAESGEVVAFSGEDRSQASRAAKRLSNVTGDPVYHLRPSAQAAPASAAAPQHDVPAPQAKQLADWWQGQGFQDVTETPQGVIISLGPRTQLVDIGDRLTVNGEVTQEALSALTAKAKAEWGGEMELFGSDEFKNAAWLKAQKDGVRVVGFQPSAETLLAWEAEKAKAQLKALTARSAKTLKDEIGKFTHEQVAFIKNKLKAEADAGSSRDTAETFAEFLRKKKQETQSQDSEPKEPEGPTYRL